MSIFRTMLIVLAVAALLASCANPAAPMTTKTEVIQQDKSAGGDTSGTETTKDAGSTGTEGSTTVEQPTWATGDDYKDVDWSAFDWRSMTIWEILEYLGLI